MKYLLFIMLFSISTVSFADVITTTMGLYNCESHSKMKKASEKLDGFSYRDVKKACEDHKKQSPSQQPVETLNIMTPNEISMIFTGENQTYSVKDLNNINSPLVVDDYFGLPDSRNFDIHDKRRQFVYAYPIIDQNINLPSSNNVPNFVSVLSDHSSDDSDRYPKEFDSTWTCSTVESDFGTQGNENIPDSKFKLRFTVGRLGLSLNDNHGYRYAVKDKMELIGVNPQLSLRSIRLILTCIGDDDLCDYASAEKALIIEHSKEVIGFIRTLPDLLMDWGYSKETAKDVSARHRSAQALNRKTKNCNPEEKATKLDSCEVASSYYTCFNAI